MQGSPKSGDVRKADDDDSGEASSGALEAACRLLLDETGARDDMRAARAVLLGALHYAETRRAHPSSAGPPSVDGRAARR